MGTSGRRGQTHAQGSDEAKGDYRSWAQGTWIPRTCRRASVRAGFARGSLLLMVLAGLMTACAGAAAERDTKANPGPRAIRVASDITLTELQPGLWLHESKKALPGFGPYPSNGLVVLAPKGAILIDTPWDNTQTRALLAAIESELGTKVRDLIVTHSHDDRMGGIVAAHEVGVESWAIERTLALAGSGGLMPPRHALSDDAAIEIDGEQLVVLYPGPGHAPDNIVVWLPRRGVLFAGCLVKALSAKNLGNTKDADVPHWKAALSLVSTRFPDARIVIPGHGESGDRELLVHTQRLVDERLAGVRQP
jgi:metallo-beta-lactamase class B